MYNSNKLRVFLFVNKSNEIKQKNNKVHEEPPEVIVNFVLYTRPCFKISCKKK